MKNLFVHFRNSIPTVKKSLGRFNKFLHENKTKRFLYYFVTVSLFLYIFSIPSFAGRPTLNLICYFTIALLIGSTTLYILLFGIERTFDKRSLIIIFFILSSFVGTISFSRQFRGLLTLFLLAISFFAIYLSMMIINNSRLIMIIFVSAFFIFSIYFIIHYLPDIINYKSFTRDSFRLGWDFENPNAVGSFMSLGISLGGYLLISEKRILRFLFLIPILSFAVTGLTTGSRTFIVSVIVIVISLILVLTKKHIVISLLSLFVLAVGGYFLYNYAPFMSSIKFRIDETINSLNTGVASGSTLERILWQRYGFYLASRRILFGFGESGFAYASGVMTYTHGNFTEMLCDFGLIGFVLFYLFNVWPAFALLFDGKKDKEYVYLITVVLLINGFLRVYYYDKSIYVILALCFFIADNPHPCLKRKREHYEYYAEINI